MDITVTGIDEKTDIHRLLLDVQPHAEIGILFSLTHEDRPRYPRIDWIAETAKTLSRCALHVCGANARHFIRMQRPSWVERFQRVQINGTVSEAELEHVCQLFPRQRIITQHRALNQLLVHWPIKNAQHQLLVDGSGGRGLVPANWESPTTSKSVGFAGGLGPKTIQAQLPKILAVARIGWWIDMENAVRNADDQFDIGLARQTIDLALETERRYCGR